MLDNDVYEIEQEKELDIQKDDILIDKSICTGCSRCAGFELQPKRCRTVRQPCAGCAPCTDGHQTLILHVRTQFREKSTLCNGVQPCAAIIDLTCYLQQFSEDIVSRVIVNHLLQRGSFSVVFYSVIGHVNVVLLRYVLLVPANLIMAAFENNHFKIVPPSLLQMY
ncbi:MAG: hypothetical protein EZS28_015812 [Streblomastix strix]|uniref:Uncharacterized protein n=1 Tax=Streblomastix strix TaxID=222440 RepID=A0A5J4W1X4_9EUKA|nr:MAG: hypothetical protein EZS28_015812 [Streblomastix strix]